MDRETTVQNTFGQFNDSHIKAIEDAYEEYLGLISTVENYLATNANNNKGDQPDRKRFLYLHMSAYCREAKDELIPSEVGLAVFSMKDGVIAAHNCLVEPGYVPFGQRGEVTISCRTNGLPIPGTHGENSFTADDVMGMFKDVERQYGLTLDNQLLVFVTRAEIPQAISCLRWLTRRSTVTTNGEAMQFKVISLEMLVMAMSKIHLPSQDVPGRIYHEGGAAKYIFSPRYSFNTDLSCSWHKTGDNISKLDYCTVNVTLCRVYNVLHYLCHLNGMEMTAVTHRPPGAIALMNLMRNCALDTVNSERIIVRRRGTADDGEATETDGAEGCDCCRDSDVESQ